MEGLAVTWTRAVRVWWSLTWRTALAIWLLNLLLRILRALAVAAGLPFAAAYISYVVLLAFAVIGTTLWIVKSILSAQYDDFRVALAARSSSYAKITENLPVTWNRAVKVWWSVMWRTGLAFVLLRAPLELVLVDVGRHPLGEPEGALVFVIIFYGAIMALAASAVTIWIVKSILATQYSDFRIVLASRDRLAEAAAAEQIPTEPVFGILQNNLDLVRTVIVLVIAIVGIIITTTGEGPTVGIWGALFVYAAMALAVLLVTIRLILRGLELLTRSRHKSR